MGPRGAGRRLNDQERMEILEIIQREAKVKNVDLAKRYGVSEGAIRKLKQMKDTIRNRYYTGNEHNRDKRKRGGFKRNAPFEEELYQWIVRMRETQPYQLMPLTQTAVRQQAIVLAKNYDKMANFKASPGWFARFCSRHRLDPIVAGAGAAAAAAAAAAAEAAGTAIVDVGDPTALSAEGVPQAVAVPPAVSTDETVYLMDTLAPAVTTTQVMEMVDEAAAEMAPAAEEEGAAKTDTPSINEQVHQAARQHNEAMLRAAAAKIEEAQAATEADAATEQSETSEPEIKTEGSAEGEEKEKPSDGDAATVAVGEDEIFSLGL